MYRLPKVFFLLTFSCVAMDAPEVIAAYNPVRRSIYEEYDEKNNRFITDSSRYKSWRICETSLYTHEKSEQRFGWIDYRYGKFHGGFQTIDGSINRVQLYETDQPVITREGFIDAHWVNKTVSPREKYAAQIALLSYCLGILSEKKLTKISCMVFCQDRFLRRWLGDQGFQLNGIDACVELLKPKQTDRHASIIQTNDAGYLCFIKKIS